MWLLFVRGGAAFCRGPRFWRYGSVLYVPVCLEVSRSRVIDIRFFFFLIPPFLLLFFSFPLDCQGRRRRIEEGADPCRKEGTEGLESGRRQREKKKSQRAGKNKEDRGKKKGRGVEVLTGGMYVRDE